MLEFLKNEKGVRLMYNHVPISGGAPLGRWCARGPGIESQVDHDQFLWWSLFSSLPLIISVMGGRQGVGAKKACIHRNSCNYWMLHTPYWHRHHIDGQTKLNVQHPFVMQMRWYMSSCNISVLCVSNRKHKIKSCFRSRNTSPKENKKNKKMLITSYC